jgi:hypothetical protein
MDVGIRQRILDKMLEVARKKAKGQMIMGDDTVSDFGPPKQALPIPDEPARWEDEFDFIPATRELVPAP